MQQVLFEYAICKWADRESAQFFPLNEIHEHTCENGDVIRTIFDAFGRSVGEPNFGYPRPATEEIIDGDVKYYRFNADDENNILVYRKTGNGTSQDDDGSDDQTATMTETVMDGNILDIVLSPGTIYVLSDPVQSLRLSYVPIEGDCRECGVIFTTDSSYIQDDGGFATWSDGYDKLRFKICDQIEANKNYVLSIQNGILVIKEVNSITE